METGMDLVEFADKVRPLLEELEGEPPERLASLITSAVIANPYAVRGCNCSLPCCQQGAHGIRDGRSGAVRRQAAALRRLIRGIP